jgi:HEAT repeat protein
MGLFKISQPVFIGRLIFSLFCLIVYLEGAPCPQRGHLLFLIQQGKHQQALDLYKQIYESNGAHDYEIIHDIGLTLLDYGFRQRDPETQLMALFGASVAAHEDAFYILEESTKSPYPQIQLIAINALGRLQQDRADKALNRLLNSAYIELRLEAVYQLCLKKHPDAVAQTQSLMYKTPKALLPIYPKLFALVGNEEAMRQIRRLLIHPSEKVRLAAILSIAKYRRDDLLTQIRQQASHLNYAQQEAAVYTLGVLKDEQSIEKIKRLTHSQYPHVRLAANQALYRLGHKEETIQAIEKAAKEANVFAIAALGEICESIPLLKKLIKDANLQVRLNAILALLAQHHPDCLSSIHELLVEDKRQLAFTSIVSPGGALEAWKAIPSASLLLKDDVSAYLKNIVFKESILLQIKNVSELACLQTARLIFDSQQNELIPAMVEILEEINSSECVELLKQYQQKPGAPLIRHYCSLALYRLKEPGPYGHLLRQWVQKQNHQELIRFRPFTPWEIREGSYQLTPEETSRLLVETFEAFAAQEDPVGIDTLISAIRSGHAKNKYALAGLLLRATQ